MIMLDEQLSEILNVHRSWLRSNGRTGSRADLSHMDLRMQDLRGADLSKALLCGANLERADLRGARLVEADLSKARLAYALLDDADMNGADLTGASASGARLSGARLRHSRLDFARFDDALCAGADFRGVHARRARLNRADLQRTSFDNGLLEDADFRDSNLSGASMPGSRLWGADFSGSRHDGLNLLDASMEEVVFDAGSQEFAQPEEQVRLTPRQTSRLIKLHRRGKKIGEIAGVLGVGRAVIRSNLSSALSESHQASKLRSRQRVAVLLTIVSIAAFSVASVGTCLVVIAGIADFLLALTEGHAGNWSTTWYGTWVSIVLVATVGGTLSLRSRERLSDNSARAETAAGVPFKTLMSDLKQIKSSPLRGRHSVGA